MKVIKAFFLILLTLYLILYPLSFSEAEEAKYQPAGPLNIRNQMPMYLFYISMPPGRAETLKKGRLSAQGRLPRIQRCYKTARLPGSRAGIQRPDLLDGNKYGGEQVLRCFKIWPFG